MFKDERLKHSKLLYSPVFIICCILFVGHQLMQQVFEIRIPLADNYLDNLLATPILLTLLVVERRMFFGYGSQYVLSVLEVIIATLFIAIVGEFLFPYLANEFTFDWLDFLFYFLGSGIFYATLNKEG